MLGAGHVKMTSFRIYHITRHFIRFFSHLIVIFSNIFPMILGTGNHEFHWLNCAKKL